jgi:DNA adenine methylase
MTQNYQRSFLKWAGGKFQLLSVLLPLIPVGTRLIEPFVGSGVVFLNTNFEKYYLNDSNPDLINLYTILKNEPDNFIHDTSKLFEKSFNTANKYYELRERFNTITDIYERARLFVYFNRHGYNGLCRYNQKGGFNVPFGRYERIPYFPEAEMYFFAEKSKKAIFSCLDFSLMMKKRKQGDVIYCDPPYVPVSPSSSFTQYHERKFSLAHQEQLNALAIACQRESIPVIISNHHTPYTETLYKNADITSIDVRRFISCQGNHRQKVKELIAIYP